LHPGDDAQEVTLSASIEANGANCDIFVHLCKVAAPLATSQTVFEYRKFGSEILSEIWIRHQQERETLGRLFADARQATEQLNDATKGLGKHGDLSSFLQR
jgi:hypothetical protein